MRPETTEDSFAPQEAQHQEDQEDHQEEAEQDFRDIRGAGRDAGESERTGDQGNDEEDQSPFQHWDISGKAKVHRINSRARARFRNPVRTCAGLRRDVRGLLPTARR